MVTSSLEGQKVLLEIAHVEKGLWGVALSHIPFPKGPTILQMKDIPDPLGKGHTQVVTSGYQRADSVMALIKTPSCPQSSQESAFPLTLFPSPCLNICHVLIAPGLP